jgi:hypothetical protein
VGCVCVCVVCVCGVCVVCVDTMCNPNSTEETNITLKY